MRKSRFTDEQMVAFLREAGRDPKAGVAKSHGISEQTIHTWRKRFGAMQSDCAPAEATPDRQRAAGEAGRRA